MKLWKIRRKARQAYIKAWRRTNKESCRAQRDRWARSNPSYYHIRHPVSYDASGLGIGLFSVLSSEQKSPLDLLMEKEENGMQ